MPNINGGGWVGNTGPGADRGQIISDDVGNDVDPDARRGQRQSQLASSPAGEAFPDLVHRSDIETRAQEKRVELGQIGGRKSRLGRADQTGGSTGEEYPDFVGRPNLRCYRCNRVGGCEGARAWLRVIAGYAGYAGVNLPGYHGRHDQASCR